MSERFSKGGVAAGLLIVSIFGLSFLGIWDHYKEPQPNPTPNPLLPENTPDGTIESSGIEVPGQDSPSLITPPAAVNPSLGVNTLYNSVTNTNFSVVPDPKNLSRQCVGLAPYTDYNKQDVWGAATAFGESDKLLDTTGPITVIVYQPGSTSEIGRFSTDVGPDHATFGVVPVNTVICRGS